MDAQDLAPLQDQSSDSKSLNPRRSARLNTSIEESKFPTSEATIVSLSTFDNQISSPAVDSAFQHHDCFTGTNSHPKNELKVTSSSTNVSILTQSTAPSVPTTSSSTGKMCAPIRKVAKQSSTRRSKRLTSARLEYNKKQRSRLFVKPTSSSSFASNVPTYSDNYEELHKAILKSDLVTPSCIENNNSMSKKAKLSHANNGQEKFIDVDAIFKRIAFLAPIPTIFNTSPESHISSYLYKSAYGSDYHSSLLEREQCSIDRILAKPHGGGSSATKNSGRPRTRSICREEEKELSRILSPSTAPAYITSNFQCDITARMRSILVNWIIDVARELNLRHETIHSCVRLMDRALEEIQVAVETFHTFGCACLLIAIKLNEVKRPRAVDIAFFTDSACTTREICDMEMKIGMTLKFNVQVVTAFHFLDRFLDASSFCTGTFCDNGEGADAPLPRYCPKHHAMSLFIIDTSLLIPALIDVKESLIAAAALYLSRAIIGIRDEKGMIWNSQLTHHTGYSVHQFADIVSLIHFFHKDMGNNEHMKALVKKYDSAMFHHVACKASILTQDLKLP